MDETIHALIKKVNNKEMLYYSKVVKAVNKDNNLIKKKIN